MSQKPQHYQNIIVGAGLAGLSAALKIEESFQEYIVLEARDYVGGRVCTKRTQKGNDADLGASWIGPTQTRMYEICNQYKLQLIEQYEDQQNLLKLNDGRILRYRGLIPPINILSLLRYQWLQWEIENLANTVVLGEPSKTPNAKELDSITLDDYLRKHISGTEYELVTKGFQVVFGVPCNKISLLYGLYYIKSCFGIDSLFKGRGGAQHHKVVGGTSQITKAMSLKIKDKILLNSPLQSVTRREDGFYEVVAGGKIYTCQNILLTCPPSSYKNIQFKPELPTSKQIFMDGSKFLNPNYKIVVFYKTSFWRKMGLNGFIVSLKGLVLNLQCGQTDPESQKGKLIGFIDCDEYEKIKNLDRKQKESFFIEEIVSVLGEEARDYVDFSMNEELNTDIYMKGCPIGVTGPNVLSQIDEKLYQPVDNIYFAGTEMAHVWHGYMEGAVRSGERAAAMILKKAFHEAEPNISNHYAVLIKLLLVSIIIYLVYSKFF